MQNNYPSLSADELKDLIGGASYEYSNYGIRILDNEGNLVQFLSYNYCEDQYGEDWMYDGFSVDGGSDFEVPKTIVFKGKQIEIPWTQRTFLKTAYMPLFYVLNRELGKHRTYNINSSILYQDEDFKIIMKSGEKVIEINIEGLVIPLSRVK